MTVDMSVFDEEPVEAPLNTYQLATPEGRQGFLWGLAGMGEEGLLAAVSHVWGSLAAPRAIRCGLMAGKLGVSGKGKAALHGVLQHFLVTFDIEGDPPPLPLREAYASSEEWHAAVSAHFGAGDAAMQAVIDRYALLLNGDSLEAPAEAKAAVVLQGPWMKLPRRK